MDTYTKWEGMAVMRLHEHREVYKIPGQNEITGLKKLSPGLGVPQEGIIRRYALTTDADTLSCN